MIFRFFSVEKKNRNQAVALAEEHLPWWTWGAAAILIVAWILSWTRFPWFERFQIFTFTPLWLGYIGIVNGVTKKRSGSCMITHRRYFLITLFFLSAVFWWFFEYLNRFVQNWYYIGIDELSPLSYFIYATLPFSTVLPAVLCTCELIKTFPGAGAGLNDFVKADFERSRLFSWIIFIVACTSLLGIGIWPDYLFPCLWLSPMLIITSMQSIQGRKTIFSDLRYGHWKKIYLMAMSALICGFFWEMWNFFSFAKWEYSIPFAGRFEIFEMPVAGYAGYLTFGLECLVISDLMSENT